MKRQDNKEKVKHPKKTGAPWSDYLCMLSMKMKPVNEAFLDKFAFDWTQEARSDEKYISIWKYPLSIGLVDSTVYGWMERNENVKTAHKYVKAMCAIRRDSGAVSKEFDGSYVAKSMPLYCEDWKKMEEWRANLAKDVEQAGGPQIVVIEKYPESDKVPKKKD